MDAKEIIEKIKECIVHSLNGETICEKLKEIPTYGKEKQKDQKSIIDEFQETLKKTLSDKFTQNEWHTEYKVNEDKLKIGYCDYMLEVFERCYQDRFDICGKLGNYIIIIEIDKGRADQVAKKTLSRIALNIRQNIIYISICLPGTQSMNINESRKYFKYGRNLIKTINPESIFMGCVIEEKEEKLIIKDYF